MRRREATRVLLLDPYDRLLLIKIHDPGHLVATPGRVAPDSYWITVGGGLEGAETFEEAALREIAEEIGITDALVGPALWERSLELVLNGERLLAVERYHVAWTSTTDISFANVTDQERLQFVEHRWWAYDELADDARTDVAFPDELVTLLQQALVLGRPTADE